MSENEQVDEQPEVDPIAEAILHGGVVERDEPEAGGEDVVEEAPVEEELILGKFKSPEDLIEAYKNLESHSTQTNQRLSELEALLQADDEENAFVESRPWGVSFEGEPQNEEQLIGWAESDPGAAAQWAIQNADRVPKETVDGLWEHWFQTKPAEANAWYVQQQTSQIQQQYEERLAQIQAEVAPLRDAQTQNMFEGALSGLEGQIPDLADYSEKIMEYVDNIPVDQLHLAFFPNGMDTPEKVQEGVKSLYAIVRMREAPMQVQSQPQVQAQNQAFTQSRQGVADQGATDYAAKINDAILNAR